MAVDTPHIPAPITIMGLPVISILSLGVKVDVTGFLPMRSSGK
jgi:hypothetical protein